MEPRKGITSLAGSEDWKTCVYHPNQKGNTIEECVEFKTAARYLLDDDLALNM